MKRFCHQPWTTVNIVPTGEVFSCTCGTWNGNILLGNILEQKLSEIYQSSKNLEALRNSIQDESFKWCREDDCSELGRLPIMENPFTSPPKLPTNLTLAIDFNCNLKCPSCRQSKIFSSLVNPTTVFILEQLAADYKDFDQQVMVMLDGSGDVFVSPSYHNFLFGNQFPRCWQLEIITNGNLIVKKKTDIEKIASNINTVGISLDAATPETYAITRGGNFEIVLQGIEMLLDMNIPVNLQFVLQSANYKELLQYKAIANRYGVHYGVQKIDRYTFMTDSYWDNANVDNNPNIDLVLLKDQLLELSQDPYCNLDGGVRWLLARL